MGVKYNFTITEISAKFQRWFIYFWIIQVVLLIINDWFWE